MKPTDILSWQGIELALPANWEMVRYGRRRAAGVCTFMDELSERLHFSWQRGVDKPELGRLLAGFTERARAPAAEGGQPLAAPVFRPMARALPWQGMIAVKEGRETTRAARYFEAERTLVELAIFWERERDAAVEEHLLASVRASPEAGMWRWRAFGLDADVPCELDLTACVCLPGDTRMTFAGRKALPAVTFHRMAFPSVWLKEPLEKWLATQQPPRAQGRPCEQAVTAAGHELVCSATARPRGRLGRWVGRKIHRREFACLCPVESRVLRVAVESAQPPTTPVQLRCVCGEVLPAGAQGFGSAGASRRMEGSRSEA